MILKLPSENLRSSLQSFVISITCLIKISVTLVASASADEGASAIVSLINTSSSNRLGKRPQRLSSKSKDNSLYLSSFLSGFKDHFECIIIIIVSFSCNASLQFAIRLHATATFSYEFRKLISLRQAMSTTFWDKKLTWDQSFSKATCCQENDHHLIRKLSVATASSTMTPPNDTQKLTLTPWVWHRLQ